MKRLDQFSIVFVPRILRILTWTPRSFKVRTRLQIPSSFSLWVEEHDRSPSRKGQDYLILFRRRKRGHWESPDSEKELRRPEQSKRIYWLKKEHYRAIAHEKIEFLVKRNGSRGRLWEEGKQREAQIVYGWVGNVCGANVRSVWTRSSEIKLWLNLDQLATILSIWVFGMNAWLINCEQLSNWTRERTCLGVCYQVY